MTVARGATAQTVSAGSRWPESDLLNLLEKRDNRNAVVVRWFASGGTNIMPLLAYDKPARIPQRFDKDRGYYRSTFGQSLALQWGQWALAWDDYVSDFYEGNRDAVRVYLAAERGDNLSGKLATPSALMDRSDVHQWQVSYASVLPDGLGTRVGVRLHWLGVARLQKGTIEGVSSDGAFSGDLLLRTTRGLPRDQVGGRGYAIDLEAATRLGDRMDAVLVLENALSGVWIRKLQRIEADVNVDHVVPDADGFLHAAPLLSGQVTEESYRGKLARHIALVLRYDNWHLEPLLMVRKDPTWRVGVGAMAKRGGKWRAWMLLWSQSQTAWQAGLSRGNLDISLGWSGVIPGDAREATASLRWRIPLPGNSARGRNKKAIVQE